MAYKPATQQFTQSWNKTVSWAKQNNIPYSAYYPVYQMDSQRLLTTGSGLPESERIRAIQAAAGMNYSTALPTDQPDWTHILGNTKKNAQDIFTGLNPIHLFGNAFDTVKNTIEHPSTVMNPLGDLVTGQLGKAGQDILGNNNGTQNILNWVPGVYDLSTIFANDPHLTGGKGAEALAQNPLTAIIDVIPFGRLASEGLGRTAVGETAAGKIGLSNEEMRKLGIWRVGSRLIKTAPAPTFGREVHPWLAEAGKDPETGTALGETVRKPTMGDLITQVRRKFNIASEQADISEEALKYDQSGTKLVEKLASSGVAALAKLSRTPGAVEALNRWARTEHRGLSVVMHDASIPLILREAYEKMWDWGITNQTLHMQAGEVETVVNPLDDGNGNIIMTPEDYYVNTDQYRNVSRARNAAESAEEARQKAAEPVAELLYKTDENDRNIYAAMTTIDAVRNDVYESIKRSIPHEDNATAQDRLRSTLPTGERWDRAVSEQTPYIRNILGLRPSDRLTLHAVNALRDLFAPGGLFDEIRQAYRDQDWVRLNKASKAAIRKLNNQAFNRVRPLTQGEKNKIGQLQQLAQFDSIAGRDARRQLDEIPTGSNTGPVAIAIKVAQEIQKFSVERQKMAKTINRTMVDGPKSVMRLAEKAAAAHQNWIKVAIQNPPDVWRNIGMDSVTTGIAQAEKTAAALDEARHVLTRQGWADSELTKTRQSPRTMTELMTHSAKTSLENNMLPDIDHGEYNAVMNDWLNELASLRARGHKPMYVHMMTDSQLREGKPTYNIFIRGVKARKPSGSYQSVWGYTPSIYDIGAGLLQDTKDLVTRDTMNAFIENSLKPRLHEAGPTDALIANYYQAEIQAIGAREAAGENVAGETLAQIAYGRERMNLVGYDPKKMFGSEFSHPGLDAPFYIDKSIAKAFGRTINDFQFPAQSVIDRGTKLFRFAILGLSPRYTAHILLGGTFLVALRSNPGILKFIGNGLYFARHGSFSEKTLERFPHAGELEGGNATQEGMSDRIFHYAMMKNAGKNWLIPEWLANHGYEDTWPNRIRAMGNLNMTFTQAIVRMQKAMVYLDGAARSSKEGSMFYASEDIPREATNPDAHPSAQVDAQGRPVKHAITGKHIHDTVRSKVPMTPQQAHNEGMQAVAHVMGNLRHMTPLERTLLQKVFPFYGWTKHILTYVLSYPFDHPYRAVILSQLARQSNEDTASGLPLRIQLLTFLGQPDQYGNVTAIDTKSLDPLRDTANYASWTGLFESLNPAITGLVGTIDPQITFGGQNPYPNITYNALYGINTAGPGGNLATAAEQFVPQLTALDEAINFSGQFAYLKTADPASFRHKVIESLGLPLMPQQLNLRQMAAQTELDRYKEAANAAYKAASTGDQSYLAGYPANAQLPDPLNTEYNVTPAYIAAMSKESEDKTGLPFLATTAPPPNPPIG